jgi:hypothetical protein
MTLLRSYFIGKRGVIPTSHLNLFFDSLITARAGAISASIGEEEMESGLPLQAGLSTPA